MILNRSITPEIQPISSISWLGHGLEQLSNGSKVYTMEGGLPELTKIEIIFKGGNKYQQKILAGNYAGSLLKEGTKVRSGRDFNESIDFYGGFLSVEVDRDYVSVILYTLNKYLDKLLPLVSEMLTQPAYPADVLAVKTRNAVQQLATDMSKVNFRARRKLTQEIMGAQHYYGVMAEPADYEKITSADLQQFHDQQLFRQPATIIVSGGIPFDLHTQLERHFGQLPVRAASEFHKIAPQSNTSLIRVSMENTMQSAIRYGKLTIPPHNEDAAALEVAVMVLGGFFGSRLMKNIREDKGFTYGIHAGILQLQETAMLTIGTEVGNESVDATLFEIDKELTELCATAPSIEELTVAKNYMAGQLVKDADGAMAQAEMLRFRVQNHLPEDYHSTMLSLFNEVSPEQVRRAAELYLKPGSFTQVIAG